jgi:hypothetical protein
MSHVTHDQNDFLLDDRESPSYGAPAQLTIHTTRDAELVTTALELRAADLNKLAKTNAAEGYPAAARAQQGDAGVIKNTLIPQLAQQINMRQRPIQPLAERARDAFKGTIEEALRRCWAECERLPANVEFRYETGRTLSTELGDRVAQFAGELFEAAYHAGLSERRNTFTNVADRAASQLEL